jgi:inorganic pyrophosphatase
VPSTHAADGDPIDVLVLMDEPVPAGVVVPCRLVGAIEAEQRDGGGAAERNDRLLAVAEPTHRYRRCRSIEDIDPDVLDELERFFVFYNQQQGREFKPIGRAGAVEATRLVQAAQQAWAAKGAPR